MIHLFHQNNYFHLSCVITVITICRYRVFNFICKKKLTELLHVHCEFCDVCVYKQRNENYAYHVNSILYQHCLDCDFNDVNIKNISAMSTMYTRQLLNIIDIAMSIMLTSNKYRQYRRCILDSCSTLSTSQCGRC